MGEVLARGGPLVAGGGDALAERRAITAVVREVVVGHHVIGVPLGCGLQARVLLQRWQPVLEPGLVDEAEHRRP